jgi:hypothetical protein
MSERVSTSELEAQQRDALAALGVAADEKTIDALMDPAGALGGIDRVLASEDARALLIRCVPEHAVARARGIAGSGAEGEYGPEPILPVWLRVRRGGEVTIASLYDRSFHGRRAKRVVVEVTKQPCCEAASCRNERLLTATWLEVEGDALERLLVAEERSLTTSGASPFGARLAKLLGVPLEGASGDTDEAPASGATAALTAAAIARYAMHVEAGRVVVRDFANRGPRATARRNYVVGFVFLVVAAGFWAQCAMLARSSVGSAVAFGAFGALFTLAGYAFVGVARFSSKYVANSVPMIAIGLDRLIVAPWVSRSGAIDLRQEGRFGAAIPLAEVTGIAVVGKGDQSRVEIASDHGPFDVAGDLPAGVAAWLAAAVVRAVEAARHPKAGATARQRLRAREAAPSA